MNVSHSVILEKLRSKFYVRDNCTGFIADFLRHRRQRVITNSGYSTQWGSIPSGVPQGSIIGPILFATVLNDFEVLDKTRDVSILHHIGPGDRDKMQEELTNIQSWSVTNSLSINVKKTKSITFSRSLNPINEQLLLNGIGIEECTTLRILGLTFDSNMKWKSQCTTAVSKCWRAMSIIRYMRRIGCPDSILAILFNSLVFPHIVYAWPAWCDVSNSEFSRLNPIIKLASKWTGEEMNCSSIRNRLNYSCHKLLKKIKVYYDIHPLSVFFIRSINQNYSLRNNGCLKPKHFNSSLSRNGIFKFC